MHVSRAGKLRLAAMASCAAPTRSECPDVPASPTRRRDTRAMSRAPRRAFASRVRYPAAALRRNPTLPSCGCGGSLRQRRAGEGFSELSVRGGIERGRGGRRGRQPEGAIS